MMYDTMNTGPWKEKNSVLNSMKNEEMQTNFTNSQRNLQLYTIKKPTAYKHTIQ